MKLSIVIPAYNEEESLRETLPQLYHTLKDADISHEIFVIKDNTKDKNLGVLEHHSILNNHETLLRCWDSNKIKIITN
jgi:dolichol-phosphate mannosyltransferase